MITTTALKTFVGRILGSSRMSYTGCEVCCVQVVLLTFEREAGYAGKRRFHKSAVSDSWWMAAMACF